MYSVLLSVDTAVFIFELTYLWTAMCSHLAAHANGAFESCLIDHLYELNAHERHHKVVVNSEKLNIFFKPRVSESWACQWENVSDAMDAAKDQICSVCIDCKFVEINTIINFMSCQIKLYKLHIQNIILLYHRTYKDSVYIIIIHVIKTEKSKKRKKMHILYSSFCRCRL